MAEEKTEDVKAGLRKTAAGKGAEKSKTEKGEEKKDAEEEPKPVTTVTFWQTFRGGLLSAPTLILMGAIAINMFTKRFDPETAHGKHRASLVRFAATQVGSALVTKMENSEWRQRLRADVAAKEREVMEKKGKAEICRGLRIPNRL
eukprot:Skav210711  [mRNA]  locus=scaffold1582:227419:230949:+ [translate_table: standard]